MNTRTSILMVRQVTVRIPDKWNEWMGEMMMWTYMNRPSMWVCRGLIAMSDHRGLVKLGMKGERGENDLLRNKYVACGNLDEEVEAKFEWKVIQVKRERSEEMMVCV